MSYLVGNPKDRSSHRDYGGLKNFGVPLGNFFNFLVYGSSNPNFCILEKKKIHFLLFLFPPM